MPHAIMLVFSQPTSDETDAAFNDWYTNKHLHDLVTVPGVVAATRYRIAGDIDAEALFGVRGPEHPYLAIYEIEGETEADLKKFAETLQSAMADGTVDVSPNLDMGHVSLALCLPMTDRLDRA